MFRFYCAPKADLGVIAEQGFRIGGVIKRWDSLQEARDACTGLILVVNTRLLPEDPVGSSVGAPVPPTAIVNLAPYRKPKPVTAAGGYIVRRGAGEPEVLVIFRRGVWDLPKGKLDAGETVEECALREVREEIGIEDVHLHQPVGTTEHGYDDKEVYAVKTTHWFLMRTADTTFTPQKEEDIEQVAWMPWSEAVGCVGYEVLRDHMLAITADVHRVLASR